MQHRKQSGGKRVSENILPVNQQVKSGSPVEYHVVTISKPLLSGLTALAQLSSQ